MAYTAGRNDLCPCGSGRKFKKCCAHKDQATRMSRMLVIILGAALIGAIVVGITQFTLDSEPRAGGKVWDPAHGHYH